MTRWDALRARFRNRDPWWAIFPTRRLGIAVLVVSPLWLIPDTVGSTVAGLTLGAVLLLALADFVMLPGRGAMTVTRTMTDTVGLSDPLEVTYTIASAWWMRASVRLDQELPVGVEAPLSQEPIAVPPRHSRALRLAAVAHRRGRHELGRVAMRVTTSLGLLVRIERAPLGGSLLVVPSLSNVRRFRLLAMQNRLSDAGIRALRLRGEGQSLAGLREYVSGDDPRLIDWKATARHNHLVMREHTVERSQTVFTMIDCGRSMTQVAAGYSRLEHVLSAALLLTDVAATGGDQVGLLAFDDSIRLLIPPRRGRAALRAAREGLTGLTATMTEPDYSAAFRTLALRQRRRALIVFFTDVIDVRASRALIAYLGRSTIRHSVVVVAIRNEELLAAATPRTSGAAALYLNAAAEELVRERAEALARMRRSGVTVLDVGATQMAAAVVNRYLEVKAKGLL